MREYFTNNISGFDHKQFNKQLRDAISQLPNLETLTCVYCNYQSKGRSTLLKFKYDFFKNMKSLKSLIVTTGSVVKYDTSREIDIYYTNGSAVSRNKHGFN
jgi:hypothetical protein